LGTNPFGFPQRVSPGPPGGLERPGFGAPTGILNPQRFLWDLEPVGAFLLGPLGRKRFGSRGFFRGPWPGVPFPRPGWGPLFRGLRGPRGPFSPGLGTGVPPLGIPFSPFLDWGPRGWNPPGGLWVSARKRNGKAHGEPPGRGQTLGTGYLWGTQGVGAPGVGAEICPEKRETPWGPRSPRGAASRRAGNLVRKRGKRHTFGARVPNPKGPGFPARGPQTFSHRRIVWSQAGAPGKRGPTVEGANIQGPRQRASGPSGERVGVLWGKKGNPGVGTQLPGKIHLWVNRQNREKRSPRKSGQKPNLGVFKNAGGEKATKPQKERAGF